MTVTAPPIINITIQIMYLCPAVAMVRDPFGSPADCCTITSWPSLSHDCFCQTFIISRSYSIKITDKGRIVISWLCTSPQVTPPVHPEILPFLVQGPTTLEKALQVLGISYIQLFFGFSFTAKSISNLIFPYSSGGWWWLMYTGLSVQCCVYLGHGLFISLTSHPTSCSQSPKVRDEYYRGTWVQMFWETFYCRRIKYLRVNKENQRWKM